MEPEGPLPHS